MPKPFPEEFRRDVVAVARKSDRSIASVARDFGISESCLQRWLAKADVEDGLRPGATKKESTEPHQLKKRNPELEQENEIPRWAAVYFAKELGSNEVPAGSRPCRDGIPVAVTCRLLGFSKQAFYAWKAAPVSQRDWDDAQLIHPDRAGRPRDPPRRPDVRVPVHRPRAPRPRDHGRPQPGVAAMLERAALVGARQEARPEP